jgi:hypothetical protein
MDKLRGRAGETARRVLEEEFGLQLGGEVEQKLGDLLGPNPWVGIIGSRLSGFMSGLKPSECPAEKRHEPGSEKCIALCYQGSRCRSERIVKVLGPTDPSKAPPGTIRREFGSTIMVNAAHASDSPENAQREMGIVKIAENNMRTLIEDWYSKK